MKDTAPRIHMVPNPAVERTCVKRRAVLSLLR